MPEYDTHSLGLIDELFAKRIILLDKEITESNCGELVGRLVLLDLRGKTSKKPIVMLINSFGGFTSGALGVTDVMENCVCPVYTVCIGIAQSAASIILAAGSKRFALKNADIMVHQHWQEFPETLTHKELMHEAKMSKKSHDNLVDFYVNHTNVNRKKIEEMLAKDTYLTAEESLKCGLIDEIGWNIHDWIK